jgi:hypothetical protein
MSRFQRHAAIASFVAGILGLAWFVLELMPPSLGFDDTDNPATSLRYLDAHSSIYAWAGLLLMVAAASLLVAALSMERITRRDDGLLPHITAAVGLIAATLFFLHGVGRSSVEPLLYVAGLDQAWGESAYLALQMIGLHGFAQGGIVMFSVWIVLVAVVGYRSRAVPGWFALLAFIPGLRLLGLVAPIGLFEGVSEIGWLLSIVAIPLGFVWVAALGVVLGLRSLRPAGPVERSSAVSELAADA